MADLKSLFLEVLKKLNPIPENLFIEVLKGLGLMPPSGFGSITINFQNFKIVNVDKKESVKL